MSKAHFEHLFPGEFFLSIDDPEGLLQFLRERKLVGTNEVIRTMAVAGTGNMNCVLRVTTDRASLIVKQSRPWVEKYPSISAPRDRVLSEARFYAAVAKYDSVAGRMPKLIACDAEARVITLEDLGESRDFGYLYRSTESLEQSALGELCDWLTGLHGVDCRADRDSFANLEMRRLNHEHLFCFPLNPDNGLHLDEITPGLSTWARAMQRNDAYVDAVMSLGDVYLNTGDSLLHGDFFPGSWLRTDFGVRVIDPEFSFCGRPEFDVGVLLAHMQLSDHNPHVSQFIRETYRPTGEFDWNMANQFAGIEIMRRLIGVAQLPLEQDLQRKRELLQLSRELVLNGSAIR